VSKKDPLDIEWWESPVTGGFDWEVWTLPIFAMVGAVVGLALRFLGVWPWA
jgi:hypothetical protein